MSDNQRRWLRSEHWCFSFQYVLAPLGKTYETSCNCQLSPPSCVQLRCSKVRAGGSSAARSSATLGLVVGTAARGAGSRTAPNPAAGLPPQRSVTTMTPFRHHRGPPPLRPGGGCCGTMARSQQTVPWLCDSHFPDALQ